jgi:hypothetical protein
MNGHHGGCHQTDRVARQRSDHFLAPFAADKIGFALLLTHGESLDKSLDQS